jgi:hypothetical protein
MRMAPGGCRVENSGSPAKSSALFHLWRNRYGQDQRRLSALLQGASTAASQDAVLGVCLLSCPKNVGKETMAVTRAGQDRWKN